MAQTQGNSRFPRLQNQRQVATDSCSEVRKLPRIRSRLSASKLYVIFAMLRDNLRPTEQLKWRTHIIGIAAGPDRSFARPCIRSFEREYRLRPRPLNKAQNTVQTLI